jgi:hypothetical protein
LLQLAIKGLADVEPVVVNRIDEARAGIARCKATLRGWGVIVEDHPDDDESSVESPCPVGPIVFRTNVLNIFVYFI